MVVGRVFSNIPLDGEPDPLLRLTVRGWIGYVESASLEWLERRDAPRDDLRDLLVTSLIVLVGVARGSAAGPAAGPMQDLR